MKVVIFSIILVASTLALISIKLLIKKNGTFEKKCNSVDPLTGLKINCTCDRNPHIPCKNEENEKKLTAILE